MLYKKLANRVIKENYITEYKLENKKIQKRSIFKVLIYTDDIENVYKFLEKNNKWEKLEK